MKLYERYRGTEVLVKEICRPDYTDNYLFSVYLAHHWVRNLRDLPILYMILNDLLFVCVAVPLVWCYPSHFAGCLYLAVHYYVFFGRYMCVTHEFAHTQVFQNKWLGNFITLFVLGHSHGLPYGSYYINHVVMHHKGANAWGKDFSSTEKYNRELWSHFLHYWLRHYSLVGFVYDCVRICVRHGRLKIAAGYMVCCLCWTWLAFYLCLFSAHGMAALYTMVLPLFITGLFGAVGGWMQHFFVHPSKPRKWYSYDIINSYANTRGFNQGFHNTHHTLGNLHWTELPGGFQKMLPEYDQDDVLIIQELDNVQVFVLVMLGAYEWLANFLVTTKPGGHSIDECVQYIRSHLRPVQL